MTADHSTAAPIGKQAPFSRQPRSAEPTCELWQAHARRSFAAARGSGSAEIDPVRLLQRRWGQPSGDFIRRFGLAHALRDAQRT